MVAQTLAAPIHMFGMLSAGLVSLWNRCPYHNNPMRLREKKALFAVPAAKGRLIAKDLGWSGMLLSPAGERQWEKSLRES
jgi:hypothetical protein